MLSNTAFKNSILLTLAVSGASLISLSQPVKAAALIDQAVFANGDLTVTDLGAYIYGAVHTNGDFNISGGGTITGLTSAHLTVFNDGTAAPGAGPSPGVLAGGFSSGVSTIAYPTMATIVAALGVAVDHEFFVDQAFSGTDIYSGVYLVHGNITIDGDASGTATFLAEGIIDISGSAHLTGAVLNASFPFGLALYSSTASVLVSGDAAVAGSVAAFGSAEVSSASPVVAPEPSSALLLGIGCLGAAMTRKRKKA